MKSSVEKSQWDCIKENIGIWQGSFIQFSPTGECVKETPSVLTLEETAPDEAMTLTLKRMPEGEPKKVNHLTFTYPGPAPYTYYFKSGAFSQGSAQWSAFGQFVTEYSMKVGDRRIRFVIAYDSTQRYTSALTYVTLICETQPDNAPFKDQPTTLDQLSGEWNGVGEVLDPIDGSFATQRHSQWTLKTSDPVFSLRCEEQIGENASAVELTGSRSTEYERDNSVAKIVTLDATDDGMDYQLMLLPKGAYCLLPREIRQSCRFRIEVGWVSETEARSRFIRAYDDRGVWTHSALISDRQTR